MEVKAWLIVCCLLLFALGCSTQKDIIRDKKVDVKVPEFKEQLTELKPVNIEPLLSSYIDSLATDSSYYEGEKITGNKDTVKVKVYLKDKDTGKPKIEISVKQHPVEFAYTDTTHQVLPPNKSFWETIEDYLIYIIIIGAIVAFIIVFIKLKK